MQELDISFGRHRADTNWKPEYLTWDEFIDRIREIRRTKETMAQYDKMNNIARGKIKDGPAFVGGLVRGGRRKKENIDTRSLITLDVDHADNDFLFTAELVLGGTAYVVYSTHSHRPEKPKYRLIVLPDRAMSPDEYGAVSRKLAEQIGMQYFDKTTFDVHRLMYLPSCSQDATPVLEVFEGEPLSVDSLLGEYVDWRDPLEWPRHADDRSQRQSVAKRMEDPRAKQGVVGTFCRCYSISEAIAEFLSDVYEPVEGSSTRYTHIGSTSHGGLVVYDDDTFAYSHHESDPVSGREVNAFDLVRIHKFGQLDEQTSETDVIKLPSYLAMRHFAQTLPAVQARQQVEATEALQAEFGDDEEFQAASEIESAQRESAATLDLSSIKIPLGFKVIDNKLFEVKETQNDIKHIPVCDYLVAVTKRHLNLTDGTYGLDVTWKGRDGLHTVSNTRSTFVDNKKIINLADYGFPVHSGNARTLATYLSRFESANAENIKTEMVSNQMGWVKGGFLLGTRFIGDAPVEFLPKDTGDGQIASGLHTKGSMTETYTVLERVKPYIAVKMTLFAALAAPILHLVDESPFIFELAGGTSKGKTTALRIAASLFGCPDEQKPGFFKQWNMTKVYVERYAATMNHLPLFIDDTKKADPKMIPPTVYQFCSGQGRGRGSLKGSQIGATWRTVMLSTGEQKLTSFSKDGGAAGRILSLHDSPFEATDLETGAMIDGLNATVGENYGHFAEPWIRFLAQVDGLKPRIAEAMDVYRHIASAHGEVAMRLARIMAILDITGQLFDACFDTCLYDREELKHEWLKLITGTAEVNRPLEALEDVMGWIAAHNRQFLKGDDPTHYGPVLSGRIKEDEIIVIGEQLDAYLQSKGYEPTSIARAWKDIGWLNTEEGRTKKSVRIAGGRAKAYCFNLRAIGWTYEIPRDYSEFGED
ncbi:hypothetical protein AAC03nite_28300 [Alicyclobacillus acidoterrestris]|nr:hypothetical protein AAC03nite_28300 [Alicyclobacillus acidoterrestris]